MLNKKHVQAEIAISEFKRLCKDTQENVRYIKSIQLQLCSGIQDEKLEGELLDRMDKLDVFISTYVKYFQTCEVVYKTDNQLYEIAKQESIQLRSEVERLNKVISEGCSQLSDLQKENSNIRLEVERLNKVISEGCSQLSDLQKENNKLRLDIEGLNKVISEGCSQLSYLQKENNNLRLDIGQLLGYEQIVDSMYGSFDYIHKLIEIFEDNQKALQTSVLMKGDLYKSVAKQRKGANSPRYIQNVKDESLIADYNAGLPVKEIAEKYGITYQTVKNRLEKCNVWKGRDK